MTLLDDLKALIAKYDAAPAPVDPAPVDTAPVDPVPVEPAPVDTSPADPVPAPAIIGGAIAVDGQDLLAKLASAVDGDTIGLADGGEFGALTISNIRKQVTIEGSAHFDALKIKSCSGLTFRSFLVHPTTQPIIDPKVKGFNITIDRNCSDLVFDDVQMQGRIDAQDWVNWTFHDWTDWRMGALWSEAPRVTVTGCRAIGVQMGYMMAGKENQILNSVVYGFSDDGARLCEDNSSAIGNIITDRVMISGDHPDGIQVFKTSGLLSGLTITGNTIRERTQNINPALRTHLQGICGHNGPYAGVNVTGNTVETTSTLGVSFNNVDGLLIDGNNCTHTDKVWGKYPSIRVTNSPNWTVTNNVAHTFILPSGTWIMKPAPGNACPVYA